MLSDLIVQSAGGGGGWRDPTPNFFPFPEASAVAGVGGPGVHRPTPTSHTQLGHLVVGDLDEVGLRDDARHLAALVQQGHPLHVDLRRGTGGGARPPT